MIDFILLALCIAVAAACWHVAQALLLYSTGQTVALDQPHKRFWFGWALLVVGLSQRIDLPWGPLVDSFWWLLFVLLLELPAAQGVRLFCWLLLAGFIKRLALMGLLQFVR